MSIQTDSLQAIGDPTRRAILKLLRGGSMTAGDVAAKFELSKPTLSHHFKTLEAAGLVRSQRNGNHIVYTLQANVIEDMAADLLELVADFKKATHRKKERS